MTSPRPDDRIRDRLDRASNLLDRAGPVREPDFADDASLQREALRLRPRLEALVGRDYGSLPHVRFRRGLGARLAGPVSQYLTLGTGATRLVLMTPLPAARGTLPTMLAHELAHRYAFDESLTVLRGLEVSARLGEEGDPVHAASAARELARCALGAAMADALAAGRGGEVDRFFASHGSAPGGRGWDRLRSGRRGSRSLAAVYAHLPCVALETAEAAGTTDAGPIPHPRLRVDSLRVAALAVYTAVDALTGRRRETAPVAATLRLWQRAVSAAR